MGEIKIKSWNLFVGELEQGSLGTSAGQEYPTTTRIRTKKPGVNLQAGTYTIDCVGATGGVVVYVYNKDSSWDKESSSKNWQAMPLTFSLSSEKLVRFAFRKTGDSDILPSEVTDIQLLEGTYTSETIPEYQPYFLNRPAHKFTNGQWVDIPTHHFINGRWQGELTSQSPLKFRADGEMLDWRIEGKTSGNLFNINSDHTSLVWDGKECLVIENSAIVVNQIRPGYMTGIYYDKVYTPGTYTFTMKQLATQSDQTEIRVVSSAPFVGGGYNDAYKGYTAALTKQNNTHYITIVVMESTKIGFFINLHFSVNDKLYDIQLLEGSYTTDTLPPYEPYGGVGDWDEEEQKYRIPVKIEGKNFFDVKHFVDTAYCHNVVLTQLDNGIRIQATASSDPFVNYTYWVIGQAVPLSMRNAVIPCNPNTDYTLCCAQSNIVGKYISYFDKDYEVVERHTQFSTELLNFKTPENCAYILLRIGDSSTLSEGTIVELANIQILEGTYTADTLPPYEITLFTDHQLMDGDSIDFATDQTTIPLATGNNTLSVDTAVQPSKVFIKFEG